MDDIFELDREIEHEGVNYKVIENLKSNTLLVARKEDWDKGIFPLPVYIVPEV